MRSTTPISASEECSRSTAATTGCCHAGFPVTRDTDEVDPHADPPDGGRRDRRRDHPGDPLDGTCPGGEPVPRGPSSACRRRRPSLGAGGRIRDKLGNSGSDDARWMLAATYRGWGGDVSSTPTSKSAGPGRAGRGDRDGDLPPLERGQDARDAPRRASRRRAIWAGRRTGREFLRDYVLRHSFPQHSPSGSTSGIATRAAPIIVADGTPPPPFEFGTFCPDARPGHRLPHFRRADGTPVFDSLGPDFSLFAWATAQTTQRASSTRRTAHAYR